MAIIEEFVLKIKAKTDDLIRGGNEVERQKKKFTDDQKKRDKEEERRRRKELDHNKQVKRDLLDRIKHTKDLALKITGLAGIFSAVGFAKLTDDTIKQADALQFLGKEFGMAASRVKAFQDAARLGGGTAEGMTEALSSAASDVALHRLKGKSIYEMGGGQLLAQYGGMAGVNWDEAMKDTESYLTAKMRTISWLQKQSKETLRGVDQKQAASQLAIEAGMTGIMNPMQDYAQFQKDLAARSRVAGLASGQEDTARKAQRELTQIQLQFEDLTKTIVMQAVAPEITKIGKAIGSLSERDKQKAVETIQKLIKGIEELATDFYKLSQDKDTKEFFKEVGGAVSTATHAIDDTVKGTIGWKNAIEGLIGLRLLAFFGGLAGAIGLGAGVGVTGAILAAAGAVALLAGNFDKVKESSKKAIGFVAEKLGLDPEGVKYAYEETVNKASNAMEWISDLLDPDAVKYAYEERINKASNAMTWISDLGDKVTGAFRIEQQIDKVIRSGAGWVDVQTKSGDVQRRTGDRNWRNNNPGNLEAGEFARQHGAIGQDSRFAVFPDYLTGRKAQESLIFESQKYKNLNLSQAIEKYAPPGENDTRAYINAVLTAVGTIKQMSEYTQRERRLIMDAMEKVEGFKKGKIETLMSSETGNVSIPKGLRIKSKEALAGGNTKQSTLDAAKLLQDLIPDYKELTGADDLWHQKNKPKSKHTQGTAFDFSIEGGKKRAAEITQQTREILAAQGIQAKVIDEYNNPSRKATGGHIHVEILKPPSMTPLPAPLPPPGATTNNKSAVNNVTMSNNFNIQAIEPKAAANEIQTVFENFARFDNVIVNAMNGAFHE